VILRNRRRVMGFMGGLRSVQSVAFGQINMPKDLRIGKRAAVVDLDKSLLYIG